MQPSNHGEGHLSNLFMNELIDQVLSTWDTDVFWTTDPSNAQANLSRNQALSLSTESERVLDHAARQLPCISISDQTGIDASSNGTEVDRDGKARRSCKLCGAGFGRKYDLARHMTSHHSTKKLLHECTMCSKTFGRKDTLTRHCDTIHKIPSLKH